MSSNGTHIASAAPSHNGLSPCHGLDVSEAGNLGAGTDASTQLVLYIA